MDFTQKEQGSDFTAPTSSPEENRPLGLIRTMLLLIVLAVIRGLGKILLSLLNGRKLTLAMEDWNASGFGPTQFLNVLSVTRKTSTKT